jgi:hypothetical protein
MVTKTFSLTLDLPFVCPRCQDPVGFLFSPNDRGEELCLGCHLDDEAIARYEAAEADRMYAPEPEHLADVDRF